MKKLLLAIAILWSAVCFAQTTSSWLTIENTTTSAVAYPSTLNVQDYGVLPDGLPHDAEFNAIKGKGNLYFPAGTYLFKSPIIKTSNLTISGDGIGRTIITTPDGTNASVELSVYRRGGWLTRQAIPYSNTMNVGQQWLDLKDSADVVNFKPGTKFFICAGAHYYDQEYGEFNIVQKIEGLRIHLKYNLSRDYSFEQSNYYGELLTPFKPAMVGEIGVAEMKWPPTVGVGFISLNNDIYKIVTVAGNFVHLLNIGKGNGTGIYPIGTKVYKGRSLFLTPESSSDVTIKDLTIIGHRKALSISNSINTRFDNVELKWLPGTDNGGIWLDGDCGRDATFTNCVFSCVKPFGAQIARSFTGIKFINCRFENASMNFSEFATDATIQDCEFNIGPGTYPPIGIGWTTSNIRIINNKITVSGNRYAISTFPDVYNTNHIGRGAVFINDNLIYCNDVTMAIGMGTTAGLTTISGNKIFGTVNYVFSGSALRSDAVGNKDMNGYFIRGAYLKFTDNEFAGYCSGVMYGAPLNLVFTNNYINQWGEWNAPGTARAAGNILSDLLTVDTSIQLLIIRDNIFQHFNYQANSFIISGKSIRTDIGNNKFLDSWGTTKGDFVK